MLSTFSDNRVDLNGETMGTRWHAQFWANADTDVEAIKAAMQAAVDRVDAQMSLWKPESDLCRLNRAPVGEWVDIGPEMMRVLCAAAEVTRMSDGAFDISVGDAVRAWGFGPEDADTTKITALLSKSSGRANPLELRDSQARRLADVSFDLNGIAKGFGTDRLVEVAAEHGITALTAGIDGDLRTVGTRPDGSFWPIAIERPDYGLRAVHSMMELSDCAIATSGDYRHWLTVGDQRLSHTMNPRLQAPLVNSPASVTVLAPDCMTADAWATALMVLGREAGTAVARRYGIQAMFLEREALAS
ncbi:FAD:protein FMN transferase [Marivivens aquimaris]|uniref:FAD:protein FMN transferase n=1 Tax=Marivivens aquimaris TaxID=2774876 RepID=UPI001D161695|nr:FAD:protein FMN transferase [Marivivens aquimaris]